MEKTQVLILEDDADLGWTYLQILRNRTNRSVILAQSLQELMDNSETVLKSRVAFLDINLGAGQPNGLDAYEWLRQNNFQGRIYFLTGHAMSHPLVAKASQLESVEVLSKPMDIDEFLKMFESRTL
jgi:ActR/RegA family two-component response regulator